MSRAVDINDTELRNADGPTPWYTDPFGGHAQTDSFPGAIRQFIARIDNSRNSLKDTGPQLRGNQDYSPTVHAPN
jgi:hypothetical protein